MSKNTKAALKVYGGGDKLFLKAWELATDGAQSRPPLYHRQWRKWLQKRGLAYSKIYEARAQLEVS